MQKHQNLKSEPITDALCAEVPEVTTEDLKCAENVSGNWLTKASFQELKRLAGKNI